MAKFEDLKGTTIVRIEGLNKDSDYVRMITSEGDSYTMYHNQDCCETVEIEDVVGDVEDILHTPILFAEESTSEENPDGVVKNYHESFTWTFYRLVTIAGAVVIRWYGSSNGYYSEEVTFNKEAPHTSSAGESSIP